MKRFLPPILILLLLVSIANAGKVSINFGSLSAIQYPLINYSYASPASITFTPGDAAPKNVQIITPVSNPVTFTASNSNIAVVTPNSFVTPGNINAMVVPGITTGTTYITVTQNGNSYFATSSFQVPVTSSVLGWQAANNAIYLDGVDDRAYFNPINDYGQYTLSFWFKSNVTTGTVNLLSFNAQMFRVALSYPNKLVIGDGYTITSGIYYSVVRDTNWHNMAVAWPAGSPVPYASCSIYLDGNKLINGTPFGTNTYWSNYNGGWPLYVGYGLPGKISEFMVFKGSYLTENQIKQYIYSKTSSSTSNISYIYHCDEGTGTTLYDAMMSGNNGSLQNGATWTNRLP